MDSTPTAGDSTSEELHRVATAASLITTAPRTQATDPSSQFVPQEGSKEDVRSRDPSKLDAAPKSADVASVGTQADIKEHEQVSTNDIRDDVSIDSIDMDDTRSFLLETIRDPRGTEYIASYHKKNNTKFSRVAAIYAEILEVRVAVVEKELLELQYEIGSKERRNESSDDDTLAFNKPCTVPLPLEVMQLSLKDWKDRRHKDKWDRASIFLATTTGISSFQLASVDPNTHSKGMILEPNERDLKYDKSSHAADVRRPGSSDIVRLAFSSPWPLIMVALLSGESIVEGQAWIYPFKHIIAYEKQIRGFVELLNKTKVDDIEPKDLPHTLGKIVSEVVRTLGPKREDVEYSDTYVTNILQKRDALKNHRAKVKSSSPEKLEEKLEDGTKSANGSSGNFAADDPMTEVSERSKPAPKGDYAPEKTPCMCTCLKDARDQMQLLVNTMDSHLGSLLMLHKAIRERVISKISFEHLWHLCQSGDVVVTSRQPCQAFRVIHVSGGRPLLTNTDILRDDKYAEARQTLRRQSQMSPFNIDCVRFDFDGEKFGPVQETFSILEYEEERLISKLDIYPTRKAGAAFGRLRIL